MVQHPIISLMCELLNFADKMATTSNRH